MFLLKAGNLEGHRKYYEEARDDLMQAYDLEPKNQILLHLLTRVHEKLGDEQTAERFFKEWKALQDEDG